MSDWHVRDEAPADVPHVHRIVWEAFGRRDEADLVDALRDAAAPRISLVAERDGALAGHVFFSRVSIDDAATAPACAGLAPLAVLPEMQRRGAGACLVRAGLARCNDLGFEAVFLLGSPAYYGRFGFVPAAPSGLHYEGEASAPYFQMLELAPGALRGVAGRVRYHDAFSELS